MPWRVCPGLSPTPLGGARGSQAPIYRAVDEALDALDERIRSSPLVVPQAPGLKPRGWLCSQTYSQADVEWAATLSLLCSLGDTRHVTRREHVFMYLLKLQGRECYHTGVVCAYTQAALWRGAFWPLLRRKYLTDAVLETAGLLAVALLAAALARCMPAAFEACPGDPPSLGCVLHHLAPSVSVPRPPPPPAPPPPPRFFGLF